jgi:hypothetical protein
LLTDGSTYRKVFIDHLLELTGKRLDDQQLKDEATTMIAAVCRLSFHTILIFEYWNILLRDFKACHQRKLPAVCKQGCQFPSDGFLCDPWIPGMTAREACHYSAYCCNSL